MGVGASQPSNKVGKKVAKQVRFGLILTEEIHYYTEELTHGRHFHLAEVLSHGRKAILRLNSVHSPLVPRSTRQQKIETAQKTGILSLREHKLDDVPPSVYQ